MNSPWLSFLMFHYIKSGFPSRVVEETLSEEQVTDININRLQEVVDKEQGCLGFLTKYQYFMGVNEGNSSDKNFL